MLSGRLPRFHFTTFCLAGAAALAAALARIPGAPDSGATTGIETALGAATGLAVRPGSASEAAPTERGDLGRAVRGRELLFLASPAPDAPADLYLARVRTTPAGRLLGLSEPVNLTDSIDGDDSPLTVRFPFAAVATRVGGRVRSLHVFHLDGQEPPRGEDWSRLQLGLARLTDLQRTGRLAGVGRIDLRFVEPPADVVLRFQPAGETAELLVEWIDGAGRLQLTAVDPRTGATARDDLELLADRRLSKRPILWLVDTVRAMPWIGPGPIEWAEGRFFAAQDRLRRLRYDLAGDEDGDEDEDEDEDEAEAEARGAFREVAAPAARGYEIPPGLELGRVEPDAPWPPLPLAPPVFERLRQGEGVWQPAVPAFAQAVFGRMLPDAPPAIYRTHLRTDRTRPYVRVQLFAIDVRQLELHMVAGLEDPQSTTGARGTGRIPRDPELLRRVVLAFNGAFKTEHGSYGMMVERTVLLPPQDGAATVASFEDGRMAMGSWPAGAPIPPEMVSLRQNMDPLVEDGVVNPRKRYLWGFTLDEDITNMNTIRSGICMTGTGTLIYAWGEDLTARTLGIGMDAAGCAYGMHLDMNPYHTAFIHYAFPEDVEPQRPRFEAELAISEMRYSPNRYVNGAPKDFFFMAVRPQGPGPGWSREGLAQPAPAFIGAVFLTSEGDSELLAVDLGRTALETGAGAADILLLAEVSLGPEPETGAAGQGADVLELASGIAVTGRKLIAAGMAAPAEPGAVVVAVGRGPGNWLLAGRGPAGELARAMAAAGVTAAVCRPAPGADPWLAVRRESAMTDFAGAPREQAPAGALSLRVIARPGSLGGRRLELPADSVF
jgi:hypothetical protein